MIVKLLKGKNARSITPDNGCEFARFGEIEKQLGVPVCFAEPHKPWQRGTNENTNGFLRFFFSKSGLRTLTDERPKEVVTLLNQRPKKCLAWDALDKAAGTLG